MSRQSDSWPILATGEEIIKLNPHSSRLPLPGFRPEDSLASSSLFAFCSYIDDTTHPPEVLGELHLRLTDDPPPLSNSGMLLHTCQRIEWYGIDSTSLAPVSLPKASKTIFGHYQVCARLAQIAAGTRSLILGEKEILRQVEVAWKRLPSAHPLRRAVYEALELAIQARMLFGLAATTDYPELARRLIEDAEDTPSRMLMVIGGGMLARSVAEEFLPDRKVTIVTRRPRKLARHLNSTLSAVAVKNIVDLREELANGDYDVVIATSNLTPSYCAQVTDFVLAEGCRTIVDLCAVPTLDRTQVNYRHLHDADVLQVIQEANEVMVDQAARARSWIEARLGVRT